MAAGIEPEKESLSPEAMLAFAAYLRENPSACNEEPRLLAKKFALPDSLVREALEIAQFTKKQRERKTLYLSLKKTLRNALHSLSSFIRCHPIFCSSLIGASGAILISMSKLAVSEYALAIIIFGTLFTLFLFLLLNFLRAEMRYSLFTSFSFSLTLLVLTTIADLLFGRKRLVLAIFLEVTVGTILLTLMFFALGSFASIMGGIFKVRKEWAEESRRNRMQILQQLFDLQEKLATPSNNLKPSLSFFDRNLVRLRKRWWIAAAITGIVLMTFRLIQVFTVGLPVGPVLTTEQSAFATVWILLQICAYALVGFIAGSWSKGILSASIIWLIVLLTNVFHAPGLGWNFLFSWEKFLEFGLLLLIAGTGGAGGTIEEVAQRKRRIAAADHFAILSEIVRLQSVLGEGKTERSAMVLDCVGSTEMKENVDPLAVEVSFSAFHEFIAKQIEDHKGIVRSVAGDGVVALFENPSLALRCAQSILAHLPEFNETSNRLAKPFRVRIGIHCGAVHGDADQVQFTSVIDIAAHAQSYAPPDSIVLTSTARERLPVIDLTPLPISTNGYPLFLIQTTSSQCS